MSRNPLRGLLCFWESTPTRNPGIVLLEALRRLETYVESGQPARILARGLSVEATL